MSKVIVILGLVISANASATVDFVLFFCGRVSGVDYTTYNNPMNLQDGEKTYLAEWSMNSGKNWGRCAHLTGTADETLRVGIATAAADWFQDADAECAFIAQNLTELKSDYKDLRPGGSLEVKTYSTSYHVYYARESDRTGDLAANAENYCKSR